MTGKLGSSLLDLVQVRLPKFLGFSELVFQVGLLALRLLLSALAHVLHLGSHALVVKTGAVLAATEPLSSLLFRRLKFGCEVSDGL